MGGRKEDRCQANPACPRALGLAGAVPHKKCSKRAANPWVGPGAQEQRTAEGGRPEKGQLLVFRCLARVCGLSNFSVSIPAPRHLQIGPLLPASLPLRPCAHTTAARWLWPHANAQKPPPMPPTLSPLCFGDRRPWHSTSRGCKPPASVFGWSVIGQRLPRSSDRNPGGPRVLPLARGV